MSATAERVRELVAPLLSDPQVVLYDVEYTGGTLRIVLDRPGGVDMATEAAAQAERASVRQLAAAMAEAQTSEIAYMNELLVAKGAAPVAAPTDSGHPHTMP